MVHAAGRLAAFRPEVGRRGPHRRRSWAFNQGFYNLFLAIGVLVGIALIATGETDAGRGIILFACGSMAAAGIVLVQHNRRFLRAALIQSVPPAVAIVVAVVAR